MNPPETQAQTPRTDACTQEAASDSLVGDKAAYWQLCRQLETELAAAQEALAEHEKLRDERLPWEEKLSEMWKNPEWAGKTWAEIAVLLLTAATAENARLTMEREHNANMAGMYKACAEKLKINLWSITCIQPAGSITHNIAAEALAEYARCSSEQPATGWRDIESEPEDGSKVQYFSPSKGIWIGNKPPGCLRGEWVYHQRKDIWHGNVWGAQDETHWQPLPPAPQAMKGEQQG